MSSEAELARSLALDRFARWRGLESDGQFRFTPPTHALLAFQQALLELAQEGGVKARAARFDFQTFYARLNDRGFVIYPGKVGNANCFRIGCIGRLFPSDMQNLIQAMRATLDEMGVLPDA